MIKTSSPLNKKLVLIVLAVSAAASLCVTAAQVCYSWRVQHDEIERDVRGSIDRSLGVIGRSVWYLDSSQVRSALEAVAQDHNVSRAEVVIDGKEGVFAQADGVSAQYDYLVAKPIMYQVDGAWSRLGEIRVFVSNQHVTSLVLTQGIFILGSNAVKGLVISFVLLALFDYFVARHLRSVVNHLYRFDLDALTPIPRRPVKVRDEMDYLIDAINDIQQAITKARGDERAANEQKEAMRERVNEITQKVAVAEVTNSVLHDINNILSSLTIVKLRTEKELKSKSAEVVLTDLVAKVEKSAKLIAGVIHTQQKLALGRDDVWDSVSIANLIEDAVAVEAYALGKSQVEISVEGVTSPVIVTRRHIFVTTLVNLIKNARESIEAARASDPKDRWIKITASGGNGQFSVAVRDSGLGANPSVLAKVFDRGFTTKSNGHGFGLSGCRFNMKNLGGDLTIQSDGPGLGATVTMFHPLDAEAAMKALEQSARGPEQKVIHIDNNRT